MPVEGTPSPAGPGTPGDGTADPSVRYVDVQTTRLYGDPLYGKLRGVRVDRGLSSARLRTPVFSSATGAPLVVTVGPDSAAPTVEAVYREASGLSTFTAAASGTLSADGRTVAVDLPAEVVDTAGVFSFQFRLVDGTGVERERNECLVYVDRGAWTTAGAAGWDAIGPPTVAELRSAVRDHPGANRLLGDFEFDVAELGQAVVSAVQAFAAEFPQVGKPLSTLNWPANSRRPLLDGVLAFLFEVAAAYNRRGMLPYSAANVAINDLNKEKDYLAAAEMYRARYQRWCKLVKTRASVMAGFGSITSGYPGYSTY